MHGLSGPCFLVLPVGMGMGEYAHNSLPSSATGFSPFQCVFGYQPPLFPSLNTNVSCPSALAYIRHVQTDVGPGKGDPPAFC